MASLFPPNEAERLAALHRLSIIDAPQSPSLDRICRVAQQVFDVPIAAVSMLDATRQWFKASVGLDGLTSTEREDSFCQYTVMHDEVFVVPDARTDRGFARNPYVLGEPGIRFYAGAPLTTEPGIRLGSLCIIDTKPRRFEPEHVAVLAGLGRLVVDELWLHHLERVGRVRAEAGADSLRRAPLAFDLLPTLTSAQVRAGRALLNWSVRELADAAGVSCTTIKRVETNGSETVRRENVGAIRQAFEVHGIEFTVSPDARIGLSMKRRCQE